MSAEQLQAFWEAVGGDTSLQQKLSSTTDGEIDTPIEAAAVVAIAKEAGFTITAGELLRSDAEAILALGLSEDRKTLKEDAKVILDLSDQDLEKVAGGLGGIPGTAGQNLCSLLRHGKLGGTKIAGNKITVTAVDGRTYTLGKDDWDAALKCVDGRVAANSRLR